MLKKLLCIIVAIGPCSLLAQNHLAANRFFYTLGFQGDFEWGPNGNIKGLRKIEPTNSNYTVTLGTGYISKNKLFLEINTGIANRPHRELHYFANIGIGYTDTLWRKWRFSASPYLGQFRGVKKYSSGREDVIGANVYGLSIALNHKVYKQLGIQFRLNGHYENFTEELNPQIVRISNQFRIFPLTKLTFRF